MIQLNRLLRKYIWIFKPIVMEGNNIFAIFALCILVVIESKIELRSSTACYRSVKFGTILKLSCSGSQKIVVDKVYVVAKHKSSGCSQEPVDPSCCQYNPRDCSVIYVSGSYRNYYEQCNGKSSCALPVSWINVPSRCYDSVDFKTTNYMKIDYFCVADQAVDPCTDLTTSDSTTFLLNHGYPGNMPATNTSCTCSIKMSCDTTVELTAIDLQFASARNCKQTVTVTDGSSNSTFDCFDNNEFLPNVIYNSSDPFLKIHFENNLGESGGKFLFKIKGKNPTGEVTLSCGASAVTMSPQHTVNLPSCPVEGDTATVPSTALLSTQTVISTPVSTQSSESSETTHNLSNISSATSSSSDVATPPLLSEEISTKLNGASESSSTDEPDSTTQQRENTENTPTATDIETMRNDSGIREQTGYSTDEPESTTQQLENTENTPIVTDIETNRNDSGITEQTGSSTDKPDISTQPQESTKNTPTVTDTEPERNDSDTTEEIGSSTNEPDITTQPQESTENTPTVSDIEPSSNDPDTTKDTRSSSDKPDISTQPQESTKNTPKVTDTEPEKNDFDTTEEIDSFSDKPDISTRPQESIENTPTVTNIEPKSNESDTTKETGSASDGPDLSTRPQERIENTPTVTNIEPKSNDSDTTEETDFLTDKPDISTKPHESTKNTATVTDTDPKSNDSDSTEETHSFSDKPDISTQPQESTKNTPTVTDTEPERNDSDTTEETNWIAIILGSIGGLIAFVIIICICCCIIVTLRGGV